MAFGCLLVLASLTIASVPATETSVRPGSAAVEDRVLHEDFVGAFSIAVDNLSELIERPQSRPSDVVDALHDVARVAHLSGDQYVAEYVLEEAQRLASAAAFVPAHKIARLLLLEGLIARYTADRDRAARCYRDAEEILGEWPREHRDVLAGVLQAQGSWNRSVNLSEAIAKYERALAIRRSVFATPSLEIADNLTWLGWTLFRTGREREAFSRLDEAELQLRALGIESHSLYGVIQNLRAEARMLEGDWLGAESLYREGTSHFCRARQGYLPGFPRRRIPLDGFRGLAASQLLQGKVRAAWRSLQSSQSFLTQDFLRLATWASQDSAGYEEIRAMRKDLLAAERRLQALPAGTLEDGATPRGRALIDTLRLQAEVYRAESDFLRRHAAAVLTPDEAASHLRSEDVLVGMLRVEIGGDRFAAPTDRFRAFAWTYRLSAEGHLEWFPVLDLRGTAAYYSELSDVIRYADIAARASNWELRVERDLELEGHARRIGRQLFGPVFDGLTAASTLICDFSVLDFAIPMESLLVTNEIKGRPTTVTTIYVPSIQSLEILSGRPRGIARDLRLLAVADTRGGDAEATAVDLTAVRLRRALDRSADLDTLPVLPMVRSEIAAVASQFVDPMVIDAREMSVQPVLDAFALTGYDVIHVATHAVVDGHPERCALVLGDRDSARDSDGLLEVREVLLGWSLDCDLLTLSGCQTAYGAGYDRGEHLGFVQALLGVGARGVVSSLWPVDDWATSLLMGRFYRNLQSGSGAGGAPRGRALAEAKTWLRNYELNDGTRPFAHPTYWAGFVFIGSID